jgi:hypothetical protein
MNYRPDPNNGGFPSVDHPVLRIGPANRRIFIPEAMRLWPSKQFFIKIFACNLEEDPALYSWALDGLKLSEHEEDAVLNWLDRCPYTPMKVDQLRKYLNRFDEAP